VILDQYQKNIDAEMVRSFLAHNGIETKIRDQHIVSINWLYSNLVGGVKLLVREDQAEEAVQLLRDVEQGKTALREEDEPPNDTSSPQVARVSIFELTLYILIAIYFVGFLFFNLWN
jgi:hypothetical protein